MAINVGLDIGTSAVRAAAIEVGKKDAPVLRKLAQIPVPEGAVVAGEITDDQVVADALVQLFRSARLPRKRVVVGLANPRVIVRRVDLPYMPEEELEEALPFQTQEYLPIPVADAILDFIPLEEFTTPNGEPMMSVLVVAAQREMATHTLEVVAGAGLKVLAVDLQALALVRAIYGADLTLETEPRAVVNIGGGVTQVLLVQNGAVQFLRILAIGGQDFTNALAAGMDLSGEQAETYKRGIGVAIEGLPSGSEGDDLARRLLTQHADTLIDEIRGSIDYFMAEATDATVSRLLISGNGARLPHLANRMGRALGAEVEPVKIFDGVVKMGKVGLSEAELAQMQPTAPVPVGLGLWGEV
ncbi:MAG: type IV pilus assembly protein PilM [Acidimicrobiia bacterium]